MLRNLKQKAHSAGKSSAQIASDLSKDVFGLEVTGNAAKKAKSMREKLYETGFFEPLSDELRSLIIPGVTLEEVQEILASADGPSLTEIPDEQRGPRG